MKERGSVGTATVLFTDLVGSTELMSRLGDSAFDRLREEHMAALRKTVDEGGGDVVKNTGDGLLATFMSTSGALTAAVAAQQSPTVRAGPTTRLPPPITSRSPRPPGWPAPASNGPRCC